ncbi:MAG: hypothetical protein AABZ74_02530 [Cyanobacteriota bacterium]
MCVKDPEEYKKFDKILELKEFIRDKMNNSIFSNKKSGLYLKSTLDEHKNDHNLSFRENRYGVSSRVYFYIDFNLMIDSWAYNKKLELNLCINDKKLNEALKTKKYDVKDAYSIRNNYKPKFGPLTSKYCGDLRIETLEDLEKGLIIANSIC